MSPKLGQHPVFQAFLKLVLFLRLGDNDQCRTQYAVGEQVALLQNADYRVRFLIGFDHADGLMEMRIKLFALRIDFGQA